MLDSTPNRLSKVPIRFLPIFAILSSICTSIDAGETRIGIARQYVAKYSVAKRPGDGLQSPQTVSTIKVGRDPGTAPTSFVHAIRRHAKKLLSPAQAEQWESLVAERSPKLKRLHDERNVLRSYFFACVWDIVPLEAGPAFDTKQEELRAWLDVWMEIRRHERITHHRLCRDAWAILTDKQRTLLTRGDWDEMVRKSTGHKRAYFGDRIVTRALGNPTHEVAFKSLSTRFESEHGAIQKALLDSETRWRQVGFAIPAPTDSTMIREWPVVDQAHRAFFLSQASQICDLSRVGYDLSDANIRHLLRTQKVKEFVDLDKKIETKLTSGKRLRQLLEGAVD